MTRLTKLQKSYVIDQVGMTPKKQLIFLQLLANGATVKEACMSIKIGRNTAYEHRKNNPVFAKQWTESIEDGTDVLEGEAFNRAMDSSDNLLMFLLKGRRPGKFADRSLTGRMDKDGNAVKYTNTERAVRLMSILTKVIKETDGNTELTEKIKLLEITAKEDDK